MARNFVVMSAIVAVGLSGAQAASADPFLPVPPASFINYHVDTVHQLSQQVAYDAVVRGRLARHFHIAGPQMTSYIQHNLVLAYLPKAATYKVACVSPAGHEYYVTERLPKGTPIFALASNGKPILKRACGNPLVSALPAVAPPSHVAKGGTQAGEPSLAETTLTTDTPVTVASLPDSTTLVGASDFTGADVGSLGGFNAVGGSLESVGGGSGLGLPLAGLAGLAAIGLISSSHGSSSSTNSGGTITPVPPVPAPEPGPVFVYGLGIAGVAALILARRRHQTLQD